MKVRLLHWSFLALAAVLLAGHVPPAMLWCFTLIGIFSAVTITYLYPTNFGPLAGGNVAPTAVQMGPELSAKYNEVIATVLATAAGDTSAVITHMFALTNSEITQGFPELNILLTTNDQSQPWELSENPNYTILGLPGLVGGVRVFIKRPNTLVR